MELSLKIHGLYLDKEININVKGHTHTHFLALSTEKAPGWQHYNSNEYIQHSELKFPHITLLEKAVQTKPEEEKVQVEPGNILLYQNVRKGSENKDSPKRKEIALRYPLAKLKPI